MADGGSQDAIGVAAPGRKRAFGRSLGDFRIEGAATPNGLHPAEERLLACAARGKVCRVAPRCPEKAMQGNTVRGAFLRFLLLGGNDNAPVHENGIILLGAFIKGGIDLESARAVRSFRFRRCHIAQPLNGRNASFDDICLWECQLGSLNFDSASISGDVYLGGSEVNGEVRFLGADIGGDLECVGAKLKNAEGKALSSDGAQVTGSVFLRGCKAEGEVRFVGAKISGSLDCCNATANRATANNALNFDKIKVTGSVFLGGCKAEGGVLLTSAEIGSNLECDGAKLTNAGGVALLCERAKVSGDVFLRRGFEAEGGVLFSGAKIGGDFVCMDGSFRNLQAARSSVSRKKPWADEALNLSCARIEGVLRLGPDAPSNDQQVRIQGSVDLQGAFAAQFMDDPESWPKATVETESGALPCHIHLDGFTYGRFISGAKKDWRTRAAWLRRQQPSHLARDFHPQPFEQLAKVLHEMGHEADARWIGFEKHSLLRPVRTKRASLWYRPFVWITNWSWGLSCGYGYRPHRLFVSLLALWLICGFLYKFGAAHGGFAPKDAQVWTSQIYNGACGRNWTECAELKAGGGAKVGEIIAFNPLIYSADMLLPAIDLGQRAAWTPMWREIKVTAPLAGELTLPKWTLRAVTWAENLLGVAGVILIGAILSGIVKRD